MKNKIFKYILSSAAAVALVGCTSYEIDMPENPEPPTVGPEVTTNVVYQANPRLFATDNCLQALQAQLPRISGMDCDILWVMPVCTPGEYKSIGSPYCIRDFKGINPKYGTMADFKALVDAAHAKGMKVMLDWIANHTAWDHPWITDHPDRYKKDANGDIASPSGWSDVAQLDFNNPETCEGMLDAMKFWVEQAGIDGYRCDFADGVPESFWVNTISALKAMNPNFIMLAETANTAFYDYGFDMIYDWKSSTTISSAFNGGKPSEVVKEATDALASVPAGKSILRYVLNHDVAAENNVATLYGKPEGIPAAYVLASMLNGTPMIYSAMDVEGLSGKISFFNYNKLDFSDKLSAEYQKINAAFKASAEVRRGQLQDYSNSDVVSFTRAIPGQYLLVAVNTSGSAQKVRTPITLAGSTMTDLISGQAVAIPLELELEPYSYVIYMN